MRAPLRAVTNEVSAAGPPVSKQTEIDEDLRRIHEWRRRWRAYMSEAVLYFDDIPRETMQSYKPYLQMLGSTIQPFFDSNVTHVVSDRQISDVAAKARDKGIRVYSNAKLARFMGSLTGYTPPRTTGGAADAKLDQLLENERRQNTVNAAYARKEANFHTFRGPYVLVFDPQQVNRPLAVKEWRPAADPDEGAWPQLRQTPPGMCPFAPRPAAKPGKRRHRADAAPEPAMPATAATTAAATPATHAAPATPEARPKRRALMGPSAPGLAGLGLTEPVRDAVRSAQAATSAPEPEAEAEPARLRNPLMPDSPQKASVPHRAGPREERAAEKDDGAGDPTSAATDANGEDLPPRDDNARGNARSGLDRAPKPQPVKHDDKENQVPAAAPRASATASMQPYAPTPGYAPSQPTQASARLREFGEIVASGVQRYSQTSTKSFAANVGPSREVADLKRKVLPSAPAPSRPRAEPKRDRPAKKPGFCENCLARYDDLAEHLKGQSHVMFATNEKRFKPLNEALQRFERNRARPRLYS